MSLYPVTSKISDELMVQLQREAELRDISVSELVREKLDCSEDKYLVERLDRVEQQVLHLSAAVEKLVSVGEDIPSMVAAIRTVADNQSRLLALLQEEKEFPFGLNLDFFQVALMASFTLARGTFSHNPEAWEPYKEEARRRAFKGNRSER